MRQSIIKKEGNTFRPARFSFFYPSLIIVLSALFLFYKYLLQVSPSVMTDDLMRAFHLKGSGLGNLAAMYFYSSLILQLFVGVLLDTYSPRLLTSLAILCCASAAFIFASTNSLQVAGWSRLLMGAGTAFATISYMKMASIWFRANQFAFLGGVLATAAMLGALFGGPPLALLVQSIGWRGALYVCSAIGILLAALFYCVVRDRNPLEATYKNNKRLIKLADILAVVKKSENWLLALYSGLSFSPVAVFGGLWGNPFLQEVYQLTKAQAASLVSFLFIGFAVGAPLLGYFADRLKRRLPVMIGGTLLGLLSISSVIYGSYESTYPVAILLFSFGFGISAFMLCFAVGKEINSAYLAATVAALINTGDGLLGAVCDPLVGKILDLVWTGPLINGEFHFSASNYRVALTLLPVNLAIAVVLIIGFYFKSRRVS